MKTPPAGAARPALGSPTPFDGQAPDFDRRAGLPESDCQAIASAVLTLADVRPGDRLVEIGAGTGMIGRWFLDHPVRYAGVDLSRGMLEVFRRRTPGAPLAQADGAAPWVGLSELRRRAFPTLPFEPVLLDLLEHARLLDRFQVVNGHDPRRIEAALAGEHVGTIVYRDIHFV